MLLVFGAQSHGFTACSLRLKAASQPTNQGSLPVTRHVLPGGIQTHRVSIETFLCFHVFLPFPLIPISLGLAGATSVPRARQAPACLPHHLTEYQHTQDIRLFRRQKPALRDDSRGRSPYRPGRWQSSRIQSRTGISTERSHLIENHRPEME
jgi:hypothetical protein